MSVSQFIAFRYMKSNGENRAFSWITVLSITGMAIGIAALIVVISVINGFEFELRNRFLQSNAHIMAYRYPAGMTNPEKWEEMFQKDFGEKIRGVSPFVHYETMLKKGGIMQGVLVRGIVPRKREKVQSLKPLVFPLSSLDILQREVDQDVVGDPPPAMPAVVLGKGLLDIINAKVGDTVMIVSPSPERTTEMVAFKVVGTYNSGLKHYDNRLVVMSLPAAKKLFKMNDVVTGIEIGLHNPDESVAIATQFEAKYNLTFREWQSFNRPLFETMEKERAVIAPIVGMVVLVAAFNILTTIFVSVSHRQKDISILKSLGASNRQISALFVWQGIWIGAIGSFIGAILAVIVSWALEKYQFIDLPDPYFLKNLPVTYNPWLYAGVCLAGITLCIGASIYPARIAAKVTPTEGFRETGDAM